MRSRPLLLAALFAGVGFASASMLVALEPPKDQKPALPEGWTMEDMQACIAAGTPGKQQEFLTKQGGTWKGKSKMWMMPGADPIESECASTVSSIMGGRYAKIELKGEMPGMGQMDGLGLCGYDNVAQKYVSTWIDNHSTGISQGVGELSEDGKKMTWIFSFHCPVTKKPATLKQIETITGSNTKTLEMYASDPKSGKEFKMMHVEFTKQ